MHEYEPKAKRQILKEIKQDFIKIHTNLTEAMYRVQLLLELLTHRCIHIRAGQ